jgi:hypothetical protein
MNSRLARIVPVWSLIGFTIGALLTKHGSADIARMASGFILGAAFGFALDLRLRIKNR